MTSHSNLGSLRQRGVTLVELMIALVLAALIVLAATAMVVTSRASYRTQDETTRLAESQRFALDLMNRMVRLVGYTNYGDDPSLPASYAVDTGWAGTDSFDINGPDLVGSANSTYGAGPVINNSDSLTLRYFGANKPGDKDFGAVVDCAGSPVPQPVGAVSSGIGITNRAGRAYNVLYVDDDTTTDHEPSLKCVRRIFDPVTGLPGALDTPKTLIRGVEAFRVLYGQAVFPPFPAVSPKTGLAYDADIDDPTAISYRTGIGGAHPVNNWNNVVSIKIALLLRSAPGARADADASDYDLFGAGYAVDDPTTRFNPGAVALAMSVPDRTRSRRVVQTTVFLRNRVSPWPALNVD